MASPITWRNVSAPDFRSGNDLLRTGLDQINKAVQGGANVLSDLDKKQDANELAKVRASLQGLSPEEAAAVAAQGYNGPGDKTAIGNLLAGAESAARKDANADFAFEQNKISQANQLADLAEAPGIASIRALTAKGDLEGARSALDSLQARPESKVGLEQELFAASERAENEARSDQAFEREETSRNRTKTLNDAILGLQTGREEKIQTIKQSQDEFAKASNGLASFDGSGNLVIADSVAGDERNALIASYVSARNTGPKLKTAKQRRDEFTKLARENGATPAELNAGLEELRRYDANLLELSREDQALLAGANQAAQDQFVNSVEQEAIVRDEILRTHPVDPEITAMQEDARGGVSVQPGELVQNDIEEAIAAEADFVSDIDDDLAEGKEIPQLVSAMNTAVDAGYQRGNENIPYPGWVVRAAYKSVGLRSLYDPGLLNDTVTADPFKDALKRIMKQHLRSEGNGLARAQAQADFSAKKLQLKQRLNNVSVANERGAQERSGVFTESGLPSLLQREADRLSQLNQ